MEIEKKMQIQIEIKKSRDKHGRDNGRVIIIIDGLMDG